MAGRYPTGSGNTGALVLAHKPASSRSPVNSGGEFRDAITRYTRPIENRIDRLEEKFDNRMNTLVERLDNLAKNGFAGGSKKRATGIVRKKKNTKKK
jgi:hypothetical protein